MHSYLYKMEQYCHSPICHKYTVEDVDQSPRSGQGKSVMPRFHVVYHLRSISQQTSYFL